MDYSKQNLEISTETIPLRRFGHWTFLVGYWIFPWTFLVGYWIFLLKTLPLRFFGLLFAKLSPFF